MAARNDVLQLLNDPVSCGISLIRYFNELKTDVSNSEAMLRAMKIRNDALEHENRILRDKLELMKALKRNVEKIFV